MPFTRRALEAALDLGLVTASDAVTRGIRARDLSQSNGVAMIESADRQWIAKDARHPPTVEGSWQRELAVYRASASVDALADLTPRLVRHSDEHQLMIVEALADRWLRFDRCDLRSRWSIDVVTELGRSLARWHRGSRSVANVEPVRPWLLATLEGERLDVFARRDDVAATLDRLLVDDAIGAALARVAEGWRHDRLMHGDMRFANIFLHVDGSIRFVDWETAGWGDARWDLAGVIQELRSTAMATHNPTDGHERAFLDGHASVMGEPIAGLDDFVSARLALRAIQLTSWPDATAEMVEAHIAAARAAALDAEPMLVAS